MKIIRDLKTISRLSKTIALAILLGTAMLGQAHAADQVEAVKGVDGWKLQVNGNDFYVKGIVWGYTPRNENYTFNLWGKSDKHVRDVLDYEFGLMKAAGVNAVRSFMMIPPEWVTYIYKEHGIMTVVNPLMGRYGYTVGGKWVANTDYSDELTRSTLKTDMLEIIDRYKNTPGVLMYAFGNESNYGLSWSSFEIENLPEGEQNEAKARHLYSLFNEVMKAGKTIAPHVPFTIVNGDIQYIDLIAELCPDMDLLGTNVYRGKSFTSLWADVDEKLDLPILFFEFGSDAFNAKDFAEDQVAQAVVLKDQWQEMYNKSAGNGEEGNAIGGFVFEWRDEWWKYLQVENLDKQDTNASWSNQAYLFDWVEGKNNMNEEWFGITALGLPNADGVSTARPRAAYDVLSEIFHMDPYLNKKAAFNNAIDNINMDYYALKGEVRALKEGSEETSKKLRMTGGRVFAEMLLKGNEADVDLNGENGSEFSDGQMAFIDFAFEPSANFEGQFSLNVLGNVADTEPLEIRYGRRGLPVTTQVTQLIEGQPVTTRLVDNDRERVEIYDFSAEYRGDHFDLNAFYHTPRYHWGYEGDFFGLVTEATDLAGMDIWNAKAPEGVELIGKGALKGLTVLAGPEVYWGANPKVIVKYDFNMGRFDFTFMHAEDIARAGESASATSATERQSRQTTLFAETMLTDKIKLELGGIMAATEKVDDVYDRVGSNGDIILDQIEDEDTLGVKAKLSFPFLGTLSYISAHHAGLVADGGNALIEFGSRLPYSSLGNKEEYEAGMMMNFGNWMLFPRVLYRDNLVDANPNIQASITNGGLFPGITPRDRDNDPFAVLGNREARAAEVFLTWDPTGATPFYAWDNDWREDSSFAFNIGANYTEYPTFTDANLFFFEEGGVNASFGQGLPAEEVWTVSSKMIFNPGNDAKYITNLILGSNQSTGNPTGGTREYFEIHGKAIFGGKHIISGYFKKDAWGPYDFHRQFNAVYPEQVKIDYSMRLGELGALGSGVDELNSTQVGIRALYRSYDEDSVDFDDVVIGDYQFQTVLYFNYQF